MLKYYTRTMARSLWEQTVSSERWTGISFRHTQLREEYVGNSAPGSSLVGRMLGKIDWACQGSAEEKVKECSRRSL